MNRGFTTWSILAAGITVTATGVGAQRSGPASRPARAAAAPTAAAIGLPVASQNELVRQYCVGCHNDVRQSGQLSLAHFDAGTVERRADVTEKMIRKLRMGLMPPPAARRPDPVVIDAFAHALEARIDAAAVLNPNPGSRTFQRLNRAEYQRTVRGLLSLDVDVSPFLPPDTVSGGFDNVADVQNLSPTVLEGYLRAASQISRLAVGDREASAAEATYSTPKTESQLYHVDGTPWGTRGGISVVHTFPADGAYTFRLMLQVDAGGQLYGRTLAAVMGRQLEQIDVSLNGQRVALFDINPRMSETDKNGLNLTTPPIDIKAGPQHLAASFVRRFHGPVDDIMAPIEYTMADTVMDNGFGITTLPHLRNFSISGPFTVTGVSDTPSRRKIFVCRPVSPADEVPCARKIIGKLATEAYRKPRVEVEALMNFYRGGREEGDFESGIQGALQALLSSPEFVFRFEAEPGTARPGTRYRISDVELASRLAFFLWGEPPDANLLHAATLGTLRTPVVLEQQLHRMLADARSDTLATRFASQWLRLQDVDKIRPDPMLYPSYDDRLAQSYKRETELFFGSIVREDRNVLDLLSAEYTFVNERTAKVYGIPNIAGDDFQRVTVTNEARRGLLGHGSILMLTSIADRTSPVQRGKWIMEVLFGAPPPPPPPDVPALDETKPIADSGKTRSVRERMEEHRKNPSCTSCHRVMDPLGLALENFDVIGAWRIRDNGTLVDPTGVLYDGAPIGGPAALRDALLHRSDLLVRNFTENLMAYALGRRTAYFDQPTIRAIARRAARTGNRFSSFVIGVVNSAAFQMANVDAATITADVYAVERRDDGAKR